MYCTVLYVAANIRGNAAKTVKLPVLTRSLVQKRRRKQCRRGAEREGGGGIGRDGAGGGGGGRAWFWGLWLLTWQDITQQEKAIPTYAIYGYHTLLTHRGQPYR